MVRNPTAYHPNTCDAGDTPQRTLRHAIGCVGIGRHTGARVAMTLRPAEAGSGIRCRRGDKGQAATVAATPRSCRASDAGLALESDQGVRVASVEHLMAALALCALDNVLVEVSGPEVPALDGSAQPFIFLIECAGFKDQDRPRPRLEVVKPVSVGAPARRASLVPAALPELAVATAAPMPPWPAQSLELRCDGLAARQEIAPARSVLTREALERLQAKGLARGCSTANTVIVEAGRVANEEGLRFEDELARHRLLDALGALYLLGMPVVGRYVGEDAGHRLDLRLLAALLADETAWRVAGGADAARAALAAAAAPASAALSR